jgi:hypothetical protein
MQQFKWDERKARRNRQKHGISFDEATTIFKDPFSITILDPDHSDDETRFIDIGFSDQGRLLVVVYTERDDHIRIISSRVAHKAEQESYERDE